MIKSHAEAIDSGFATIHGKFRVIWRVIAEIPWYCLKRQAYLTPTMRLLIRSSFHFYLLTVFFILIAVKFVLKTCFEKCMRCQVAWFNVTVRINLASLTQRLTFFSSLRSLNCQFATLIESHANEIIILWDFTNCRTESRWMVWWEIRSQVHIVHLLCVRSSEEEPIGFHRTRKDKCRQMLHFTTYIRVIGLSQHSSWQHLKILHILHGDSSRQVLYVATHLWFQFLIVFNFLLKHDSLMAWQNVPYNDILDTFLVTVANGLHHLSA